MPVPASAHQKPAWLKLLGVLLVLLPAPVMAADVAGRIISTVGEVLAFDESESQRELGRGDEVFVGEYLTTSDNGRAQIRFIDDGLVDIRPNSRFEVIAYDEAADQESGKVAMELTTGALRTVTGRIGNRSDDDYEMNTDVATMGIRGTDYSLQLCTVDCADSGYPEGLYGRVDDGIVTVTNQTGTVAFSASEYFFVDHEAFIPEQLTTPPPNVLAGHEDGSTSDGPGQGSGPPDWAQGDGPPDWVQRGGPPDSVPGGGPPDWARGVDTDVWQPPGLEGLAPQEADDFPGQGGPHN